MVIQIFVLSRSVHLMLMLAQLVSNYSMPIARPLIHPETLLILKKKVNTCNFSRDFKIGPGPLIILSHV